VQRGTVVDDAYLDSLATVFDTGLRSVDIRSNPGGAQAAVNLWTANATAGRTTGVLPPDGLSASMALVSTGALWVSAPWLRPFDPRSTRDAPFTTADGRTQSVTTMRVVALSGATYGSGDGWEAVGLPYLGRQLDLVVVVPTDGSDGPDTLQQGASLIGTVLDRLRPRAITLRMPKFSIGGSVDLTDALGSLVGPELVDRNTADLGPMAPGEPLALDALVQAVPFAVDEVGTSAGRVTTAGSDARPARLPTTEVEVDRPFLALIVDRPTGIVVAVAYVADPTAVSGP
jgi:serpin B